MNEFHKNKEYFSNGNLTAEKTREELNMGLALLNKINEPIVAFFGSQKSRQKTSFISKLDIQRLNLVREAMLSWVVVGRELCMRPIPVLWKPALPLLD